MSEQPKLLVIELDDIDSVPRVIFEGVEIENKARVDFTYITKGHEEKFYSSPYINIEQLGISEDKKPYLAKLGCNERDLGPTAQMLVDAITEGFKHLPSAKDLFDAYEKGKEEANNKVRSIVDDGDA